jgi:formylglycine-generating enzyme required for sulfatase activity
MVPSGEFVMGTQTETDIERPLHTVNIDYDYFIGRFPVTNKEFAAYAKIVGYTFESLRHVFKDPKKHLELLENHPVKGVKWFVAQDYIQYLNSNYVDQLPEGYNFRLPSEAEWEKAARGVDGRKYPWGNKFDKTLCNSAENGINGTTPVGNYSPQGDSQYGMADASGNVSEWTRSIWGKTFEYPDFWYPYNKYIEREDQNVSDLFLRVIRGGCFADESWRVRCAFRNKSLPSFSTLIGFRVAIVPKQIKISTSI